MHCKLENDRGRQCSHHPMGQAVQKWSWGGLLPVNDQTWELSRCEPRVHITKLRTRHTGTDWPVPHALIKTLVHLEVLKFCWANYRKSAWVSALAGGGVHSRRAWEADWRPQLESETSVVRRDDGVAVRPLWEEPEAMALISNSMHLVWLLALMMSLCRLRGCVAAGRPWSTTNAFTPFQYSKFQKNFFVAWSESNVAAVDGGHTLQLSLNRKSGELEKQHCTTRSCSWNFCYLQLP